MAVRGKGVRGWVEKIKGNIVIYTVTSVYGDR